MNKQRGLSLIGLLITSACVVFFALIGFKLLPSYIEYFTVQRILSDIAHSPELRGGTIKDVQGAFDRRALIDNVTSIKGTRPGGHQDRRRLRDRGELGHARTAVRQRQRLPRLRREELKRGRCPAGELRSRAQAGRHRNSQQ